MPEGFLAHDAAALGLGLVSGFALALVLVFVLARIRRRVGRSVAAPGVDALTGLLERAALYERTRGLWSVAQRRMRPFTVVQLGIDGFGTLRQRHGAAASEALLLAVATRLRERCRAADLVARWGDAEFLLALPETDELEARMLAERLRGAVAALEIGSDAGRLRCTASMGLAQRRDQPTLEQLVHDAAHWLAAARASGGDRVVAPPRADFPELERASGFGQLE
ncbi:MAG: GGDEF domain-containing protein [Pelomonas sp.]|nr:GGDEF domain-containing protein [Roseateles sp.]